MAGLRLTFHLAGINNQNFIMRDEETGTYWQQISGLAVSGPLKGRQLTLVHSDELTFAARLYEAPPPRFTRRLQAYWRAWRAELTPDDENAVAAAPSDERQLAG